MRPANDNCRPHTLATELRDIALHVIAFALVGAGIMCWQPGQAARPSEKIVLRVVGGAR